MLQKKMNKVKTHLPIASDNDRLQQRKKSSVLQFKQVGSTATAGNKYPYSKCLTISPKAKASTK